MDKNTQLKISKRLSNRKCQRKKLRKNLNLMNEEGRRNRIKFKKKKQLGKNK